MKTSATLSIAVSLSPSAWRVATPGRNGSGPRSHHRLARGLLAATLGTVLSVFPGGGAQAANFQLNGFHEIINTQSGLCLDVRSEDFHDDPILGDAGARVQQYHCTGVDEQQWADISSADGYDTLVSKRTGMCLDTFSGQALVTPCNTVYPSYRWVPVSTGTPSEFFLVNPVGRCLDVSGGSQADHALVQEFDCNSTGAQKWMSRKR